MINRNHLAAFRIVTEAGGFSRAAEILHVTQSAVSQQMAELEETLGKQLLERLPRGVRLTPAGETLLDYARRIAALEVEAERAMRAPTGAKRERLTLGASESMGAYLAPTLLGEFSRRHPEVELELTIVSPSDLKHGLVQRKFDLALTEVAVAEDKDMRVREFGQEEFIAVAPPNHGLAALALGRKKPKAISVAQLCAQPMVVLERSQGTGELVQRALGRHGSVPGHVVLTLDTGEALKAAVRAGLGMAIVSRLYAAVELKAGVFVEVPVRDLDLTRSLNELTLKGRLPSAATQTFVGILDGWGRHTRRI